MLRFENLLITDTYRFHQTLLKRKTTRPSSALTEAREKRLCVCHHNGSGLFGAFASRVVVVPTRVQKIQQSQGLVVLVGIHTLFKKPTAAFLKKSVLCVVPLVLDITEARAATCRHNGWFSGTTMRTRAQNVLQSRRAVVVPTRSKDATVGNIFKKLFDSCF